MVPWPPAITLKPQVLERRRPNSSFTARETLQPVVETQQKPVEKRPGWFVILVGIVVQKVQNLRQNCAEIVDRIQLGKLIGTDAVKFNHEMVRRVEFEEC